MVQIFCEKNLVASEKNVHLQSENKNIMATAVLNRRKRSASNNKKLTVVSVQVEEPELTQEQEREAFLYTSRVNAANMFAKYL